MSLEAVTFGGQGTVAIPSAAATEPDEGDPTPLPAIVAFIREVALPSESMARAAIEAFKDFQRIVEALEAHAEDPDFWSGIAAGR
jgi:hypothetical protein